MNLTQIIQNLNAGHRVFWSNKNYEVIEDSFGQYFIKCLSNGHCIGLTWRDGKTLNGKEEEFFVEKNIV